MIELKTKLRRWGNSFGIVVPISAVEKERASEGDEITIIIKKDNPKLKKLFGALKNWKIDTQKLKDEIRREEK